MIVTSEFSLKEIEYMAWLADIVDVGFEYQELIEMLFQMPFRYSVQLDKNRVDDARELRYAFGREFDYNVNGYLDGQVSVFEVLVALAKRCEDNIMHEDELGDRSGEWFWLMISNLGLDSMDDDHFDEEYVREKVDIFLDRRYSKTGIGGIFHVKKPRQDLTEIDIWMQMRWFLSEKFF